MDGTHHVQIQYIMTTAEWVNLGARVTLNKYLTLLILKSDSPQLEHVYGSNTTTHPYKKKVGHSHIFHFYMHIVPYFTFFLKQYTLSWLGRRSLYSGHFFRLFCKSRRTNPTLLGEPWSLHMDFSSSHVKGVGKEDGAITASLNHPHNYGYREAHNKN